GDAFRVGHLRGGRASARAPGPEPRGHRDPQQRRGGRARLGRPGAEDREAGQEVRTQPGGSAQAMRGIPQPRIATRRCRRCAANDHDLPLLASAANPLSDRDRTAGRRPPHPSRVSLEPAKTSWLQPAGVTGLPLLATGIINGLVGGTVQVGPWKVLIPAGAFSGTGTVTISIPDPTVAQCDLNISPAALKSFKVPATLFCTFKSTTDAQASDIYWWDPGAKVWRVVP